MNIKLFNLKVKPGEKIIKQVKVAEYSDGTPISLLVRAAKGAKEGPLISMLGVQHGDEYNGMEIINRFFDQLEPKKLGGSVAAIPVSNPLAFNVAERMAYGSMGWEDLNMNRVWPGNPEGQLTDRIAATIWKNLIIGSDCVIDFHGGGKPHLIRYIWAPGTKETEPLLGDQVRKLCKFFGHGIPVNNCTIQMNNTMMSSLCIQALLNGIPVITPEFGGGGCISEEYVKEGIQGALNVLIGLGMLQGKPIGMEKEQIVAKEWAALRAEHGGICYNTCKLNDIVKKGAKLGIVKNIEGRTIQEFYAPYDSVILGLRWQPTVYNGDWLYALGKIE